MTNKTKDSLLPTQLDVLDQSDIDRLNEFSDGVARKLGVDVISLEVIGPDEDTIAVEVRDEHEAKR